MYLFRDTELRNVSEPELLCLWVLNHWPFGRSRLMSGKSDLCLEPYDGWGLMAGVPICATS